MSAQPQTSQLEYETPLGRGQCVVGSMRYLAYESEGGGVIVTAPNNEPLGSWRWVGRVVMGMAMLAMALLVLAGLSERQWDLDFLAFEVRTSPFTLSAGAMLLCLFLLRIISAAVARQRGQRVILDACAARLVMRKESGMNEEQEARLWKREEVRGIFAGGDGITIISTSGENYSLEVGRSLEERQWLGEVLRKAMRMEEPAVG